MFNSLTVTAVDPHGKLDFSSPFVRIVLVQVKRGGKTFAALLWWSNSVTYCSESSLSLTDKSNQMGLFLGTNRRTEGY